MSIVILHVRIIKISININIKVIMNIKITRKSTHQHKNVNSCQ